MNKILLSIAVISFSVTLFSAGCNSEPEPVVPTSACTCQNATNYAPGNVANLSGCTYNSNSLIGNYKIDLDIDGQFGSHYEYRNLVGQISTTTASNKYQVTINNYRGNSDGSGGYKFIFFINTLNNGRTISLPDQNTDRSSLFGTIGEGEISSYGGNSNFECNTFSVSFSKTNQAIHFLYLRKQ